MTIEKIDTLVVGAGQAGVALSEHLGSNGVSHLVLERARIAEQWRTGRWDSLVANGPAWHDKFPGLDYDNINPDAFPPKEMIADYFVAYAEKIKAPIRCGVEVTLVERNIARPGFRIETSKGVIEANNVVAATGAFQVPSIPPLVPENTEICQIHSSQYRNPIQLPDGAVLVVGAGSSGVQIADELLRAGRRVYLSVGAHERPPRAYRGRDFVWWLGVLGLWDVPALEPGAEHVTIAVSGAYGGRTIDFRNLAANGMMLVGMSESFENGILHFKDNLAENIARGDASYLAMLDEADAYIARNGLDFPEEPEARVVKAEDPPCITEPLLALNLVDANIKTIIWATGFSQDYGWLKLDIFDETGKPKHQRGVSDEPGIYFLGLPWQSRRGSTFIWGVWHDARYVADHIATRQKYRDYQPSKQYEKSMS